MLLLTFLPVGDIKRTQIFSKGAILGDLIFLAKAISNYTVAQKGRLYPIINNRMGILHSHVF